MNPSNRAEATQISFDRRPFQFLKGGLSIGLLAAIAVTAAHASSADDKKTVADLDTQYQAAVKKNDATTMDRILADDFTLVTGSGKIYSKADLLNEARGGQIVYEHQEDTAQTVRVWGDTAVVTAKLWEKGTENGKPIDYTVWFSDTYVRTPTGWRYVFGQSSLPLPKTQ
ncbi:MAG TPA: nuclear transport factor 2 family protein [Terriglobales bacterium]|nr:nuclear transport factor 2 family protein [Terriglobales bacterium]